jgi:hypothetical protein
MDVTGNRNRLQSQNVMKGESKNWILYIHVTVHHNRFLFNEQPEAQIIQIRSVIKLYMFRASSVPIIWSFRLYIRHW